MMPKVVRSTRQSITILLEGIWNLGFGIWNNLEFGIWNLEFGIGKDFRLGRVVYPAGSAA
jgi:hypothetical protein